MARKRIAVIAFAVYLHKWCEYASKTILHLSPFCIFFPCFDIHLSALLKVLKEDLFALQGELLVKKLCVKFVAHGKASIVHVSRAY